MQLKQVESKKKVKMSLHFLFFAVMPKPRGNTVYIKGIAACREKCLWEAAKKMIAK